MPCSHVPTSLFTCPQFIKLNNLLEKMQQPAYPGYTYPWEEINHPLIYVKSEIMWCWLQCRLCGISHQLTKAHQWTSDEYVHCSIEIRLNLRCISNHNQNNFKSLTTLRRNENLQWFDMSISGNKFWQASGHSTYISISANQGNIQN